VPTTDEPVLLRLRVSSREGMSDELIARVNDICDQAEDAVGEAVVIAELIAAGLDPANWPGSVGVNLVGKWERALRRLERSPVVIIAYAEGLCVGAAAETLLVADYRIVTGGFVFQLSHDRTRLWPGMALHRLVAQSGFSRARRLALFGQGLTAATARDLNFVDEVHPAGADLAAMADSAATRWARLSGAELAIRRRLLSDALVSDFEDALGGHLAACDRMLRQTGAEADKRVRTASADVS
jgi:isomerase DpgB